MKREDYIKDISIVKCKTFRGHDGDGYIQCDVKFKGKTIAEMHEDAWGGGYMYNATKGNDKVLADVIAMFKTFPKESKYGLTDSLDFLVEQLFREWQMKKDSNKGVLVKTNWGYETKGCQYTIPTAIKKYSDGLEFYQGIYDKVVAEGKEVLNKEYLKSVGIKI